VDFARRNDIWVCHDNAYSDVSFDGYMAPRQVGWVEERNPTRDIGTLNPTYEYGVADVRTKSKFLTGSTGWTGYENK
jgi:aspartate/methionine/tyrosine aminotransferase